jgi:hypothetical protein
MVINMREQLIGRSFHECVSTLQRAPKPTVVRLIAMAEMLKLSSEEEDLS